MGKVIKSVRILLSLLLAATFLYSAYKLLDYYFDTQENANLNEEMIEQSVSSISTSVPNNEDSESEITEPPMPVETSPISVDFDTLKEANEDSILVYGMVKNNKHRTRGLIDIEGNEIDLIDNKHILNFLTFLQDEVHRFTITYHRKLRDSIK